MKKHVIGYIVLWMGKPQSWSQRGGLETIERDDPNEIRVALFPGRPTAQRKIDKEVDRGLGAPKSYAIYPVSAP